jgi:hypothetical protein
VAAAEAAAAEAAAAEAAAAEAAAAEVAAAEASAAEAAAAEAAAAEAAAAESAAAAEAAAAVIETSPSLDPGLEAKLQKAVEENLAERQVRREAQEVAARAHDDEIAKAGAAAREAAFAKFGGAVQGGVRLPPAPPPAAGMPYAVGDSVLVPRSDGSVSPAVIVEIVAEKGLATVEIVGSGSSPLRKRVSMASLKPHEKPSDDAAYEDKDDYY